MVSTSYFNTQYEEIRKNPGSFEDVIKYYTTAPGVVTGNDNYNQLLVRGGAPFENLILIDGFEIPNPNHYGPPGSSNGALSYINSKLIGEVDFTGGFRRDTAISFQV
jgi:outer membrane receptor for ferrienterochelin and colicin